MAVTADGKVYATGTVVLSNGEYYWYIYCFQLWLVVTSQPDSHLGDHPGGENIPRAGCVTCQDRDHVSDGLSTTRGL